MLGVASEHEEVVGTERGANTLLVFEFGGRRGAHLGDLGQRALRDEQLAALGTLDLLIVPMGGGPTIGAKQATAIGAALGASFIVPMHYRTKRIDFLEPVDEFAERAPRTERLSAPAFDLETLAAGDTQWSSCRRRLNRIPHAAKERRLQSNRAAERAGRIGDPTKRIGHVATRHRAPARSRTIPARPDSETDLA